ncbi:MAG: magnetic particle specific iron-binding protein [Rhodospirillaceae bacterium]
MVPGGIGHAVVRNTLIAKGMAPAKAAAFPGIEHVVVRDALATKALTGTGAAGSAAVAAGGGSGAAKTLITGGTIWSGKGFSLGLGLGLGVWGPVLVGAAGAAAVYAYLRYCQRRAEAAGAESSGETADEGFMAGQI